ncbi:MAG: hypothetical protein M1830_006478, partial [Pleopsidium flavum]
MFEGVSPPHASESTEEDLDPYADEDVPDHETPRGDGTDIYRPKNKPGEPGTGDAYMGPDNIPPYDYEPGSLSKK